MRACQVDATLGIARRILRDHGSRLVQIHLSELDARCRHHPLSMATVWAIQEIARRIPPAPVIVESVIREDQIAKEIRMAAACFVPTSAAKREPAATESLSEPASAVSGAHHLR